MIRNVFQRRDKFKNILGRRDRSFYHFVGAPDGFKIPPHLGNGVGSFFQNKKKGLLFNDGISRLDDVPAEKESRRKSGAGRDKRLQKISQDDYYDFFSTEYHKGNLYL